MATGNYKVPYDRHGNLMQYVDSWDRDVRWHDNTPFTATLLLCGMYSGRSAKGVYLIGPDGQRYPMFVTDLVDTLTRSIAMKGAIEGTWKVRKRGRNYGVVLEDSDV